MITDRGRWGALTKLIDRRETGRYTLPDELLTAHDLARRVGILEPKMPEPLELDTAAARALAALAAGKSVDVTGLAVEVRQAERRRADVQTGYRVVAAATEQAQTAAVGLAADLTETIITEHLRPVHDQLLDQARADTATLGGRPLDPTSLLDAPAPVRKAWRSLRDAAHRYRQLRDARHLANVTGLRELSQDTRGQFAVVRDPRALFPGLPGYDSTAPTPRLPVPDGDVELMGWLVTDAAPAGPWLPTTDEQDARWHELYGAAVRRQQAGRAMAESVGARGPALPS